MKLVYVFDAYCGWSFGFVPTLAELVRRRPGIEVEVGLDPDIAVAAFTAPAVAVAAQDDFARAARLGVHSFPTLLAVAGDRSSTLAVGHATADQIERRLEALTTAS